MSIHREDASHWIPAHQSLRNNAKVAEAAIALGIPVPALVGHLVLLWLWALDGAPDGIIKFRRSLHSVVSTAAMWGGDSEEFLTALCEFGFLDSIEGEYRIHDWDQFGGKFLAQRAADRDRQRARREAGKAASSASSPPTGKEEKHVHADELDGFRTAR